MLYFAPPQKNGRKHVKMAKNLVIVESPAKAKTISNFLGKDFVVKSSFGHIRDLSKKQLGVEISQDFMPVYEVAPDKKKIITELKKLAQDSEMVWLASDEDREGEAISWHLMEVLGLEKQQTRRIVFHEITKEAISRAIQNPREIDMHLVDAQQARRVLDRLVGFELSPLLWKKVKPSLSAGRVQSVAVRLIVEREDEIARFNYDSAFRITGRFITNDGLVVEAELPERFSDAARARNFLEACIGAGFKVSDVEKKPARKSPAPPFTTSTLQQEAARKLGFSVSKTMMVAQQLYENGKITYMRTDSVNLSDLAVNTARKAIINLFGESYSQTRRYTTRTKGAQEAHEAIRPTYIEHTTVEGTADQRKLYELIWKRTIASQMSDAQVERTTVTIQISGVKNNFIARGEVLLFDGFLKVYMESRDDEEDENFRSVLPKLVAGDELSADIISAVQRFSKAPARYTEAALVKKLEELGIGRPSTYAPTISTIQKREYVVREDRPGQARSYVQMDLKKDAIKESTKKEMVGAEKSKLFPTDVGVLVNRFLMEHFEYIVDYQFTATVEKEFDEIAEGQKSWNEVIRAFYGPFHERIERTGTESSRFSGERFLGQDPATGKNVFVKVGRYGPMVQIGDNDDNDKPRFAGLRKGQSMQTISLEEGLELFRYPKIVGQFEGKDLLVGIGRFGPFVRHDSKFYSLPRNWDPAEVDEEAAVELVKSKRTEALEKVIKEFAEDSEFKILKGRFGPYISYGKRNIRIPKGTEPASLSLEDCRRLAEENAAEPPKRKPRKKS